MIHSKYYHIADIISTKLVLFPHRLTFRVEKSNDKLRIAICETPAGFTRIPFSIIEFLEVFSKKMRFHLADGTVKEIYGSLSDFEDKLLCREEFVKVHRSYIVNMESVLSLTAKEFTTDAMDGRLGNSASRLLYRQGRETYLQYVFMEKGVK